jgi:hypothetical protein
MLAGGGRGREVKVMLGWFNSCCKRHFPCVVERGTAAATSNTGGIYPHHGKDTTIDAPFLSPLFLVWLG